MKRLLITHFSLIASDAGACSLAEGIKKYKRLKQVDLRDNKIKNKGLTALLDAILVNKNITLLEFTEQPNADEESKQLIKQIKEICVQNKFNNQQDAIQQQQQSTQSSSDADSQSYQNSFYINGDIWNNVSLTSMNGTSSLSSTPRFSLSELFKPINTLTTTTASFTTLTTTPPPVPPSTPNNQLAITPTSSNLHSIPNSSNPLDQQQLSLAVNNIEDQVKMHMFSMSLDSPYLSSSNNSSQSTNSDLRQYSSSPGSRFQISQVDQSNKFLRSNSVNETASEMDDQTNRSAPINTGSSGNSSRMMRSCSLGSYSRYDKNERASRSGSSRFSISPVPDNEMVSCRCRIACT